MAEATLGATFSAVGAGMQSIYVDREALNKGLVVRTDNDAPASSAYDNDQENTTAMLENGWFLTGDIGFLHVALLA
ncbi:hypothetical protein NQF78_00520 [Pseudomonas monsensis]|uniref:AMP-dependent synthetase/ligase domain-containing protein n=1 Tax=Pseudomonas monsensis TaxID=2745509 RepID=A0ABT3YMQ1_9PSED|nr:hypothetical protein [Pseudomonas monsensis]MCY0106781.1 hypothetical protein [Pseudomonas monsensis]